MAFGRRITELRLAKNQSLQQVADAVGVSKTHIWKIEKGRAPNPSMDLVRRLADHFGKSVAYLVGEDAEALDEDVQLQRMFRQAKDLNESERRILDEMMQSLLKNRSTPKAG
ncbi:helix-turn-helix domain-containing protein [Euryhalocaulis caribicus]|uniref:helix-turn-helix domain-containing protein n=1 Tax=Euryhalocaulis caribicus TaxID=1161401 RepID=UPI0003A2B07D|nr:helix-turn-helix transcriptional regulator [Euryhalocaulis caribicus]